MSNVDGLQDGNKRVTTGDAKTIVSSVASATMVAEGETRARTEVRLVHKNLAKVPYIYIQGAYLRSIVGRTIHTTKILTATRQDSSSS